MKRITLLFLRFTITLMVAGNIQAQEPIDVLQAPYLLVTGSNQSSQTRIDNVAGLQAAVNDGALNGARVLMPDGIVELEFTADVTTINIPGDLEMVGSRCEETILKVGPGYESHEGTFDYNVFSLSAGELSVRDITFQGPNYSAGMAINRAARVFKGDAEHTSLDLTNVNVTGNFNTGIYTYYNGMSASLDTCNITVLGSAVQIYGARSGDITNFYSNNSVFTTTGDLDNVDNVILVGTGSADVDGCDFYGASRAGLHLQLLEPQQGNQVMEVKGNTFWPGSEIGLISNRYSKTWVTGCNFNSDGLGVRVSYDIDINASDFNSLLSIQAMDAGRNFSVRHSDMTRGSIILGTEDAVWDFYECHFLGETRTTFCNGLGSHTTFTKCTFDGNYQSAICANAAVTVDDCIFNGQNYNHNLGAIYSYSAPLKVIDSSFTGGSASIIHNVRNDPETNEVYGDNTITGSGNKFSSYLPRTQSDDTWQSLEIREARLTASIEAADTTYINFNYNEYEITGDAEIDTILIEDPYYGLHNRTTNMAAGVITLIRSGNWTLVEGGNIIPLVDGQNSAIVTLRRDGANGVWIQQ